MRRIVGRLVLGVIGLVLLAGIGLGVFNEMTARDLDRPLDASELTPAELETIGEARRLQPRHR